MKLLRYFAWLLRALLFLALFLLAAKNTDPVTVRFYFEQAWQLPLVFVMAGFFGLGVVLALLACVSKWVALRREIAALKRELEVRSKPEPPSGPPPVSGI